MSAENTKVVIILPTGEWAVVDDEHHRAAAFDVTDAELAEAGEIGSLARVLDKRPGKLAATFLLTRLISPAAIAERRKAAIKSQI